MEKQKVENIDKDIYCCGRFRVYNYLVSKGFQPIGMKPDRKNTKFLVWFFDNTKDLQSALEEYFSNKEQ